MMSLYAVLSPPSRPSLGVYSGPEVLSPHLFLADCYSSLLRETFSDPQTRAAAPRGSCNPGTSQPQPLPSIPPCSFLIPCLSGSGVQVALQPHGSHVLGPGPQEAAWRELEAERAQLQSQLQREREELLARLEAEKEELSEEIAALQQERDEGLLLAESEKQQVREPWCGPRCCPRGPGSGAGSRLATQQLGARSPQPGLLHRRSLLSGSHGRDTVSTGSPISPATPGWAGRPHGCFLSSLHDAHMHQLIRLKRNQLLAFRNVMRTGQTASFSSLHQLCHPGRVTVPL